MAVPRIRGLAHLLGMHKADAPVDVAPNVADRITAVIMCFARRRKLYDHPDLPDEMIEMILGFYMLPGVGPHMDVGGEYLAFSCSATFVRMALMLREHGLLAAYNIQAGSYYARTGYDHLDLEIIVRDKERIVSKLHDLFGETCVVEQKIFNFGPCVHYRVGYVSVWIETWSDV